MDDTDTTMVNYYSVLGVSRDASFDEIRRAYHRLAMQWHPDKWTRTPPSEVGEAKLKFQKIQEAYSVLSNSKKRAMYDIGMYDPMAEEDEDEGFCDFMQEMVSLMSQVREEAKSCSMEDLQSMFVELAQGFDTSQWFSSPSVMGNQGCSAGVQQEANPVVGEGTNLSSSFGILRMSSFCN